MLSILHYYFRCNETSLYTRELIALLINEHNRIAAILKKTNPKWKVTELFEETRRVLIAEIQHITYAQYLPLLLGENLAKVST